MKSINKHILSICLTLISNNAFPETLLSSNSNKSYFDQNINYELRDTAITEKIYTILRTMPGIDSESLSISTELGHVTIAGFVNNAGQELQIINVIKTVDNVKSIDSNVNIK